MISRRTLGQCPRSSAWVLPLRWARISSTSTRRSSKIIRREEEDDNDDTRPLTRDEIKAKTLTKMYRGRKPADPVTTKSRKKKASRSSF